MKKSTNIPLIAKEKVTELQFPDVDVISDPQHRKERTVTLHKATGLGNLERRKVHITFEDMEGLKQVYTTIWAVTSGKVLLKEGRSIPACRIHAVVIS